MIPNYKRDVEAAQGAYPDAWAHAHIEGDPRRHEFIKLLGADLHAKDANVALNGKRGDPNDLSMDAVNILCDAADSQGRTPEGLPCVVVDVIARGGALPPYTPQNPAPSPAWSVFTDKPQGSGAHVLPGAAPEPPVPQPPAHTPYPGDPVWDAVGVTLFADYASAGQSPNPQMGRWFGRTIWDATEGDETGTVVTVEASIAKHRNEWRAALGLPLL